jgi:multiple sugar transport system substrate-binding protein
MTREELLRILRFVENARSISTEHSRLSEADPRWNITIFTMRRHLEGRLITITSLAAASGAPYGTAMRRINAMIDEGLLMKRSRSRSGKSYSIHPTNQLIREFETYAARVKMLIGKTFGFTSEDGSGFYFGGSYMAARILPYPSVMRRGLGYGQTVRILSNADPTFKTLSDFTSNLREFCGSELEITTLPLDDLRQEVLANSVAKSSRYDVVALDMPWMGEMAEQGVVLPLDELIREHRFQHADFYSGTWRGGSWGGRQYGVPIQPTHELLFYRKDLFEASGLEAPQTAEDVLVAARAMHRSDFHLSGVVMNYGRGTPVAHSFIQTKAAFGEPIVNLPTVSADGEFETSELRGEHYRPLIDTVIAQQTADYLLALRDYAHPDSIRCNWDRRIQLFSQGQAAITYGWSARASTFELDETSAAFGKVGFVPHPRGPRGRNISPIGGFVLAIPGNLDTQHVNRAWRLIAYLTSPELMKWYVLNGNLVSPRFSTSADPEVRAISPIISAVDAMERRGQLQLWPRPPVAEFHAITRILGEHIFEMLYGNSSIGACLSRAQNEVDAVMRAAGRY